MPLFPALLSLAFAAASAAPRGVLFLFEDDGGLALGAYGDALARTPNLDALAARGTLFEHAYTSVSSCSPSRASLLTGLPTHQNGQFGLLNSNFYSYAGIQSLPAVLNRAGAKTGVIGKLHVWSAGGAGGASGYPFAWGNAPDGPGGCQTGASEACPDTNYNTVSRNITYMKERAAEFLAFAADAPFFFYVGFGDSHRCGGTGVGEFCELYGREGKGGASLIPDWIPFDPPAVQLPFWIQDTPEARADYAKMYTAKNRMDQGVGLVLRELERAGRANDTLVVYFADNGAPFAAGKTNLYDPGMAEPLVISAPGRAGGVRSAALASELDLMPTILDWLGVAPPAYRLNGANVALQGRSLLPLLGAGAAGARAAPHAQVAPAAPRAPPRAAAPPPVPAGNYSKVFASFQWHEQQMYFPMRAVVAGDAGGAWRYKLVYNIAHNQLYPIASDLYAAPAFQDLLDRTAAGEPTFWYRNFSDYLGTPRPKYELFDLVADPHELDNRAAEPAFAGVLAALQADVKAWQTATNDDWLIKYAHERR